MYFLITASQPLGVLIFDPSCLAEHHVVHPNPACFLPQHLIITMTTICQLTTLHSSLIPHLLSRFSSLEVAFHNIQSTFYTLHPQPPPQRPCSACLDCRNAPDTRPLQEPAPAWLRFAWSSFAARLSLQTLLGKFCVWKRCPRRSARSADLIGARSKSSLLSNSIALLPPFHPTSPHLTSHTFTRFSCSSTGHLSCSLTF